MWSFQWWSCCALCFGSPFCEPRRCAVSSIGPTEMDAFASTTCAWNAAFVLLGVWNPEFSIFFLLQFLLSSLNSSSLSCSPTNLRTSTTLQENGFEETVCFPCPDHCPPDFAKILAFCQDVEVPVLTDLVTSPPRLVVEILESWPKVTWFKLQEYGGWRNMEIPQNSGRIVLKMLERVCFYLLMP